MKRKILSLFLAAAMLLGTVIMSVPASAALNFNDTDGHWATEAIEYVVENGLMNGVGNGESFAPNMSLTRGMVVTVLYRDNGSPKNEFNGIFLDVKEGSYYTAAAEWAFENEIVNGTGTDEWGEPYFSPDRDITRQELATMFKRYADFKHVDTAKGAADLTSFPDASSVADWARDAVKWAVGVGLITGKGGGGAATLSPTDKAVRAEFATIIKRFKEAKFEYHLAYEPPVVMSTYTELPYPLVEDADVYVAVDGDDKNPGTLSKPLATFEAAKAKVRELKKTAGDEIKVAFKAGNYGALDNVQFTSEDAGSEKIPVTYSKYGDGDVIFSGGVIFTADELSPVSEAEKDIFPKEAVNLIKKMSLKGLYSGELKLSNQIFSENEGMLYRAQNINRNGLNQDSYYFGKCYASSRDICKLELLEPLPEIIQSFSTLDGLMIKGMLTAGYLYDIFEVDTFDPETNDLSIKLDKYEDLKPDIGEGDIFSGFADKTRFSQQIVFCNLPEFLDHQGEYWIDQKTKTVYIYNPNGQYTFSNGGTMITLNEGADHISFVGLEFNGCADIMIHNNADHITYDRCTFANIGGLYAIRGERINHFAFINSDIHNFVCSGIYVLSDADMENIISAENVIRNNTFHDFGLTEYWSVAVRIHEDIGTVVEHNEFRNAVHGGLRYDCCIDMTIQYNIFDKLMQGANDFGALYTINGVYHQDNVIRYNLFMNITGEAKQYGQGCYGFYVDDNTSGQDIYGNIFYNGGIHAVTLHDGRDNLVHDNIVIAVPNDHNLGFGGDLIMYTQGLSGYVNEDGTVNEDFKNTSFYKILYEYDWPGFPQKGEEGYEKWYARWPLVYNYHLDGKRINEVECLFNNINYIKNNAVIGSRIIDTEANRDATYNKFAVSENNIVYSLTDNPIFVNPAIGDYRIRDDADFHKIPYEKIGRY